MSDAGHPADFIKSFAEARHLKIRKVERPAYTQEEREAQLRQEAFHHLDQNLILPEPKNEREAGHRRAGQEALEKIERERKDRETLALLQELFEMSDRFSQFENSGYRHMVVRHMKNEIAGRYQTSDRLTREQNRVDQAMQDIDHLKQLVQRIMKNKGESGDYGTRHRGLNPQALTSPAETIVNTLKPFAGAFHDEVIDHLETVNLGTGRTVVDVFQQCLNGGGIARGRESLARNVLAQVTRTPAWNETVQRLAWMPGPHRQIFEQMVESGHDYERWQGNHPQESWGAPLDAYLASLVRLLRLGDTRLERSRAFPPAEGFIAREPRLELYDQIQLTRQHLLELIRTHGWTEEIADVMTTEEERAVLQENRQKKRQKEFAEAPKAEQDGVEYRRMNYKDEKGAVQIKLGEMRYHEEKEWKYAGVTSPAVGETNLVLLAGEHEMRVDTAAEFLKWRREKPEPVETPVASGRKQFQGEEMDPEKWEKLPVALKWRDGEKILHLTGVDPGKFWVVKGGLVTYGHESGWRRNGSSIFFEPGTSMSEAGKSIEDQENGFKGEYGQGLIIDHAPGKIVLRLEGKEREVESEGFYTKHPRGIVRRDGDDFYFHGWNPVKKEKKTEEKPPEREKRVPWKNGEKIWEDGPFDNWYATTKGVVIKSHPHYFLRGREITDLKFRELRQGREVCTRSWQDQNRIRFGEQVLYTLSPGEGSDCIADGVIVKKPDGWYYYGPEEEKQKKGLRQYTFEELEGIFGRGNVSEFYRTNPRLELIEELKEADLEKEKEFQIVKKGDVFTLEQLILREDARGYRPATHEELVEYTRNNPGVPLPLIALGSSTMHRRFRCVAVLRRGSGGRFLGNWHGHRWISDSRFLFVRK
jgi:hypothetical protein